MKTPIMSSRIAHVWSYKIPSVFILLFTTTLLWGQLNPGQIGNDQSICYGYAPVRLSFISAPTGGVLPYTYRWQRSNNLGTTWADITGTTASQVTYSPPVLSRTTMFRCKVIDATTSTRYTNSVIINLLPGLSAGQIGAEQTIDYDELPATLTQIQAPTGGDGNYSFKWQSSCVIT